MKSSGIRASCQNTIISQQLFKLIFFEFWALEHGGWGNGHTSEVFFSSFVYQFIMSSWPFVTTVKHKMYELLVFVHLHIFCTSWWCAFILYMSNSKQLSIRKRVPVYVSILVYIDGKCVPIHVCRSARVRRTWHPYSDMVSEFAPWTLTLQLTSLFAYLSFLSFLRRFLWR